MSIEKTASNYYKENIPDLIEDLKIAVQNNRKVITQDVTGDLSEDKYVNVLKSRRMAADDTIHFLKEKYQCPEFGRDRPEISPDTQICP